MDVLDRGYLITEKSNIKSKDIDSLPTIDLVKLFSKEDLEPQKAVSKVIPELAECIDKIALTLRNGGRLFYLGAGTSGRLGVLDASECPPTFCTPPDLVQGIIAGGNSSLVKSSEGLEDDQYLSVEDLKNRSFSAKDCLVGITAGGTTPYVLSALQYSKTLGALSISISSVNKEEAAIVSDIDIRLLTGPEILTGSTRLKAGTATKMVLNIISTGVMIRLGKVYKNRMVDMSVSNSKLLDRSIRIIIDIAEISRERAIELIQLSEGSVKLALLIAITGMEKEKANQLLKENNQNLRDCL